MVVEYKYRTFWRRFWAGSVDALALSPLAFVADWTSTHPTPVAVRALAFVASSVAWPAYSIYWHGRFGQTWGKRLLRIQVTDVSGEALTVAQAFRRELLNLPFALWTLVAGLIAIFAGGNPYDPIHVHDGPPVGLALGLFGLELMSTLGSCQRRALHDLVAGSLVVRLDTKKP